MKEGEANWFWLRGNSSARRGLVPVEVAKGDADVLGLGPNPAGTIDFVSSSAAVDRYHEVIEPGGWRLENYLRNPVFQNAHKYGDVVHTLGRALKTAVVEAGGRPVLAQRIEFAVESNPVAKIAYGLYKGGFLRAVSVGFVPLRWEDMDGKGGGEGVRRRYLEQELLEVSAVAIPANPEALALGLRSGGLDGDDVADVVKLAAALNGQATRGSGQEEFAREIARIMRKA